MKFNQLQYIIFKYTLGFNLFLLGFSGLAIEKNLNVNSKALISSKEQWICTATGFAYGQYQKCEGTGQTNHEAYDDLNRCCASRNTVSWKLDRCYSNQ